MPGVSGVATLQALAGTLKPGPNTGRPPVEGFGKPANGSGCFDAFWVRLLAGRMLDELAVPTVRVPSASVIVPEPPKEMDVPVQFAWIIPPLLPAVSTLMLPEPPIEIQGPVALRATIANGLFAGSAPATPRARTGLRAASAGTRLVLTCCTIVTSTYLALPEKPPGV